MMGFHHRSLLFFRIALNARGLGALRRGCPRSALAVVPMMEYDDGAEGLVLSEDLLALAEQPEASSGE